MEEKEKKWERTEYIPEDAIRNEITDETIRYAERFGKHLATPKIVETPRINKKTGKEEKSRETVEKELTSSQLRKFFGEVKRQQMTGYVESSFVLLKPKLAYAVGRAKSDSNKTIKFYKIEDLYNVLADAIDIVVGKETVDKNKAFRNFISIFEAIVAYHKAAEK